MKANSYYPVLLVEDVASTAAFYERHFRFRALFDSGWYVHLQSTEDEGVNLAIVQQDHETIPSTGRGPPIPPSAEYAANHAVEVLPQ